MTRSTAVGLSLAVQLGSTLVAACASGRAALVQEQRASLKIAQLRPQPEDLPVLRAVDLATGLVFRAYYDAAVEHVARTYIPTIAALCREAAMLVAVDPGLVDWSAVAFVQDSGYVPPRRSGEVRWNVLVDPSRHLGPVGERDLYQTLPHEQVHAIQSTLGSEPPRWFAEGMAEWAGLHVTQRRAPVLAQERRTELRNAYESLSEPLNLSGWGGVTVKREAILRQVTPEQRARMETDPSYSPPGPFRFGSGDMISDESNALARYGASLALFEMLEKTAGLDRMRAWFRAVWQVDRRLNTEELLSRAYEHTGVDLQPWFRR
ncbi:MAG: hypothetical protein Q8R92_14225 [Deltaproteobacteria bacterium]|nr:hypothetical protein [Deltaproteobacteria bacterium]